MPVDQDRRKHLIVSDTATSESFTSPTTGGGGPPNIPQRERAPHGQRLLGQLANLRQRSEQSMRPAITSLQPVPSCVVTAHR